MTATPPRTPPAMAPTFGLLLLVAVIEVVSGLTALLSTMQDVDGHVSHDIDMT